jgi:hypothetical protein
MTIKSGSEGPRKFLLPNLKLWQYLILASGFGSVGIGPENADHLPWGLGVFPSVSQYPQLGSWRLVGCVPDFACSFLSSTEVRREDPSADNEFF